MDVTLDYRRNGRTVYTDNIQGKPGLIYDFETRTLPHSLPTTLQRARVVHAKPHADIWS